MIEILFLDLDDTILDFCMAERVAITKTFRDFGIEVTEQVLQRYHDINDACWKAMEKGKMIRQQVLVRRFEILFEEIGVQGDGAEVSRVYGGYLGQGHFFLPGSQEAVQKLHKKYRLFMTTNGTAAVQRGRIASADLFPYFENIFISQEVGVNKPDKAFFDRCFAQIPGFDREKAMIVGDSLTSDIQGGINAGIKTCWVNPRHKTGHIKPDYEVEALHQLEALLENI